MTRTRGAHRRVTATASGPCVCPCDEGAAERRRRLVPAAECYACAGRRGAVLAGHQVQGIAPGPPASRGGSGDDVKVCFLPPTPTSSPASGPRELSSCQAQRLTHTFTQAPAAATDRAACSPSSGRNGTGRAGLGRDGTDPSRDADRRHPANAAGQGALACSRGARRGPAIDTAEPAPENSDASQRPTPREGKSQRFHDVGSAKLRCWKQSGVRRDNGPRQRQGAHSAPHAM